MSDHANGRSQVPDHRTQVVSHDISDVRGQSRSVDGVGQERCGRPLAG